MNSNLSAYDAASSLPLWDTFEVSVFFATGIVLGTVLGFLLPSLWRSFRRRFRPAKRFVLDDKDFEKLALQPQLLIESAPSELARATSSEPNDAKAVEEAFVYSRSLFQSGYQREAVQSYLKLLRSPVISSRQTARLYAELAQVYAGLGLYDRALALAKEYQTIRPSQSFALQLRVDFALKAKRSDELLSALRQFKGFLGEAAALHFTHLVCEKCEDLMQEPELKRQLQRVEDLLDCAERFSPASKRLKHTLALRSLEESKLKVKENADQMWVTLFGEIQKRLGLYENFALALAAGTKAFAAMLNLISTTEDPENAYKQAEVEITKMRAAFAARHEKAVQHIGHLVLAHMSTQSHFDRDKKLRKTLNLAFPESYIWLRDAQSHSEERADLRTGKKADPIFLKALEISLLLHRCTVCGHHDLDFFWKCGNCGQLETSVSVHEFPCKS